MHYRLYDYGYGSLKRVTELVYRPRPKRVNGELKFQRNRFIKTREIKDPEHYQAIQEFIGKYKSGGKTQYVVVDVETDRIVNFTA